MGFFVGSALQVNLIDSLVSNNSSTLFAGGIDCTSDVSSTIQLSISGDSGVSYNHTNFIGGGIKLSNCNLIQTSGTFLPSLQNPLGIHSNTANGNGGGLAVLNGSVATLTGNKDNPVNITSNISNFDGVSSGDGGGVFVSGNTAVNQSILSATNVLISSNTSKNKTGGGLFVEVDAVANINSSERSCNWSQFCSLIESNIAKDGGAFGIEEKGYVKIVGAEIKGNRSIASGSVAQIRNDDSQLVFEGNLIHHNGGADHTEFSDSYLVKNSFGNNSITISYSTVVDNEVRFSSINAYNGSGGNLQLFGSIVDDPGVAAATVTPTAVFGHAECNILSNNASISNLPVSNNNFEAIPAFIDRANQDYHLDPMLTIGIDRCESGIYTIISDDIDGNARAYDHPGFVNDTGLLDIGVDEVENDLIFINSFESE